MSKEDKNSRDYYKRESILWKERAKIFEERLNKLMPTEQVSIDGKHWQPAKEEPYYPMGWELIKCTFGFHELVQSKKYAHTKYCFRCGKRKQDKKFEY